MKQNSPFTYRSLPAICCVGTSVMPFNRYVGSGIFVASRCNDGWALGSVPVGGGMR